MRICGIDPGAKGALCVLDNKDPAYIAFLDVSKSSNYEIALWMHNQDIDIVIIEDVHSMYGMSAKSNFGFGGNLGKVTAIAEVVTKGKISRTVTPKIWQKYVGVTVKGKKIKSQVAEIAITMYPTAIIHGIQGGLLDGRADALMIAHYGLHT